MLLGAHLSITGDIARTVERAEKLGLDAVSIFLGSPKSLSRPSPKIFTRLDTTLDVTIHAPYVINPASPSKKDTAIKVLQSEVKAAERLGAKRIVLHPGSAVGCSHEEGLENLIEVIAAIHGSVDTCVETMAGKGRELGATFEDMKYILAAFPHTVGVCLDTCHMHDAGYDIAKVKALLESMDKSFGLSRIKIVHVNGSLNLIGSRKDRHAFLRDPLNKLHSSIIRDFVQSEEIGHLPIILETYKTEDTMIEDVEYLKTEPRFRRKQV
jgi:deoxyribonuclease-4